METTQIVDKSIDVIPFTRVLWKLDISKEIRDRMSNISSNVYEAELKTVAYGHRPCSTFHLTTDSLYTNLELLDKLGLTFLPILKCARVQGFAHKFFQPKEKEPYDIYGVVSLSRKDALRFREAHKRNDHATIGELLKYPKCCIEHFNTAWPRGEIDPIWSQAMNTQRPSDDYTIEIKDFYPECNTILRYFGYRAVPHLACSFKCEETRNLSEDFLRYIKERDLLLEILKEPMIWDCFRGIAEVRTPKFTGLTNSMPYVTRHVLKLG